MAKVIETVGEGTEHQILAETLASMRTRFQKHFSSPLEVGWCDPIECFPAGGVHPYWYIVERRRKRWLGIIPLNVRRLLFAIHPDFYGGAYGKKEVRCTVFDRSILEIVHDELKKYTDTTHATAVELTTEFGSGT